MYGEFKINCQYFHSIWPSKFFFLCGFFRFQSKPCVQPFHLQAKAVVRCNLFLPKSKTVSAPCCVQISKMTIYDNDSDLTNSPSLAILLRLCVCCIRIRQTILKEYETSSNETSTQPVHVLLIILPAVMHELRPFSHQLKRWSIFYGIYTFPWELDNHLD